MIIVLEIFFSHYVPVHGTYATRTISISFLILVYDVYDAYHRQLA